MWELTSYQKKLSQIKVDHTFFFLIRVQQIIYGNIVFPIEGNWYEMCVEFVYINRAGKDTLISYVLRNSAIVSLGHTYLSSD